ncbi:hypothetical protein NADFUDRAFT_52384 [Nadsonia fulvescens var. elongata DSM 6958]|uniref:Receptor/non-receptor type protein-tyrosine phosphatase n=1 Tax=Nadsonia fulvescens var. elongata DSM 6958 TaxID=857566 RepID=A0A1E3PH82_9ASCO|nr:hypothetical protein NADFUDRAFT_52384 [Nadsonia fulvescens var. elongata DSM 6958]
MSSVYQKNIDENLEVANIPPYLCQNDQYIAEKFAQLLYEEDQRFHPSSKYRMDVGTNSINRDRNRYNNIFPWDHSRVKLTSYSNDYINASYITLNFNSQWGGKSYIACQGPTPNTIGHFWQMLWAQAERYNSPVVIIMLTSLEEGPRGKCAKYWPTNPRELIKFTFNDVACPFDLEISVTSSYDDLETQCSITNIQIKSTIHKTGDVSVQKCHHIYYTEWSDFSKPSASSSILPIIKKAHSLNTSESPLVVHCSAGIGRTGTYIAIDYLLSLFDKGVLTSLNSNSDSEDDDLVYKAVNIQREQRYGMVQTHDQYKYIYTVLKQALLNKSSSV